MSSRTTHCSFRVPEPAVNRSARMPGAGRLAKAALLLRVVAQSAVLAAAADRLAVEPVVYCDLTPLFALVDPRYAAAREVSATPEKNDGLAPAFATDGPVHAAAHNGTPCWRIAEAKGGRYLYFDVDDAFYRPGSGPPEIALEFLDQGTGRIVLQYDSTDAAATQGGAYKDHATVVACGDTLGWRIEAFTVPDARFAGSQNGNADFRFYHGGENLFVRRVRVARR